MHGVSDQTLTSIQLYVRHRNTLLLFHVDTDHTPVYISRQHVCWCLAAIATILVLLLAVVVHHRIHAVSEEVTTNPCNFVTTLPRPGILIGREPDMITVTEMVTKSSTQILSITGPPGVGKSTLAVHIGWRLFKAGACVSYINMNDMPSSMMLIIKVLRSFGVDIGENRSAESAKIREKHPDRVPVENDPIEVFKMWAKGVSSDIVLILDNCDDHVHSHSFQQLLTNLQKYLTNWTVVMTNREATLFLDGFEEYSLHSLTNEGAKCLLQNITKGIDSGSLERISELVGNLPLALKITAKVLKHWQNICDVNCVISELESNPTEVLCPEELSESESVCPSFALSYKRLELGYQQCGRYLANFPGSFDYKAARAILPGDSELGHVNAKHCIRKLVKRSLLEVYKHQANVTEHNASVTEHHANVTEHHANVTKHHAIVTTHHRYEVVWRLANITRYNMHPLIRALFVVQEGNKSLELSEFNKKFQHHYTSELRRASQSPSGQFGYPGYQSLVQEEIKKEALNLKRVAAAIIKQNIASLQVLLNIAMVLIDADLYALDQLDMFTKELGIEIPQFIDASIEYLEGIDFNTLPTDLLAFHHLQSCFLYLTVVSNSWHHEKRCEGFFLHG